MNAASLLALSPWLITSIALVLLGVGLALRKLVLYLREQRRRAFDLCALSALSHALMNADLGLDEIGALVYRHASAFLDAPTFALQLRQNQDVTLPILVLNGEPVPAEGSEIGVGALNCMQETRQAILISDFCVDTPPFEPLDIRQPARSGLYVPIVAEEKLLGAISLQSPRPRAFSPEDGDILRGVAAQAAVGLHAAGLWRREKERTAQLMMIAEVGRKVAAILDLETLFADTVGLIQETLGYYHVSIFTVDVEREQVILQASSSPQIQERGLIVPSGQGMIGYAARTGESLLANDVTLEERFLPDGALEETRSELAIPLQVEERILGVLDLQSDQLGAFQGWDASVLRALADQIAVAVEDSQLYEAQQRQAWISTALLQVAEALAQHNTSEEIVETVVRLAQVLTGVERCLVFLWSEENQSFTAVSGAGLDRQQTAALQNQWFAPDAVPLLERVVREGDVIRGQTQDLMAFLPPPLSQDPRTGELIAFPLRSQGQVVGVLVAESLNGGGMAEPGRTILRGIANHAAMALENARLHALQREEAWVSTALLQVANVIGNAAHDLDETLSTVVRLAPMLVGIDWCAVLLWDEDRQTFWGARVYGPDHPAARFLEGQHHDPDEVSLLNGVITGDSPITLRGIEGEGLVPALAGLGSIAPLTAFPLRAHDRFLGVLLAGHAKEQEGIPGRRMTILSGVAHQTALAVVTDQLYQQTVQQERLRHEVELARSIQRSFVPERSPQIAGWQLGIEWRPAREVGGDFYDFIRLGPRRLGLVIADVSDKGVAAALYMALSRTVVCTAALGSPGPAETLLRANQILLEDSRSGMFVTVFYAALDVDTGHFTYARAGHNPPLLVRAADGSVVELDPPGVVLGVLEDVELVEESLQLEPGDALVMFTDGVTEAINEEGRQFGEERLKELLVDTSGHGAGELVDLIDAAVQAFAGECPQFDDFTLVVLRREEAPPVGW